MHSADTRTRRRYHHNGDFSGDVWIDLQPGEVELGGSADMPFATAQIPAVDILEIADRIRDQWVAEHDGTTDIDRSLRAHILRELERDY